MRISIKILSITLVAIISALTAEAFTVRGRIVDNTLNDPVPGAIVTIASPDSTVIARGTSDGKGTFTVNVDSVTEQLIITVDATSYSRLSLSLSGAGSDIDLGSVAMSPSTIGLAEVTVSAKAVNRLTDRTILIPSAEEIKRAPGMMGLLNSLSFKSLELKVNSLTNTITINGQSAKILINGVQRRIEDLTALIPENIARVEYCSYPDVRYGACWVNIITVPVDKGGSVMAYLNPALTAKRTSQQVAASYRHGANEVSINYSGGFRDSDKEYSHKEEEYIGGGNVTRLYYHGLPSTTIDRYNSLRIDYTRQPSDKRIFIASLLLDQHSQNQDEDTEVQEISSSYTERTSRDFKSLAPTLDLYYRENTSANGVMELNVTTSLSRGDYYRDIVNTTGYSDLNKINNTAWFIGGEALYSHRYSSVSTRYGIQYRFTNSDRKTTINNGNPIADDASSHVFYGYASIGGRLLDIGYSFAAGLRYNRVTSSMLRPSFTMSLNRYFGNDFSAGYQLQWQPSSPGLSRYSNVFTPVNELLYRTGNPDLKSTTTTSNRLSIQYGHGKFYASGEVFYNYVKRPIMNVYSYVDDPSSEIAGKFLMRPENCHNNRRMGMSLSMSVNNLLNHLSLAVWGGWGKYSTRGEGFRYEKCSWNADAQASFYWDTWTVNANFTLIPGYQLSTNNLSERSRFSSVDVSYRYRQWTFSASISQIFSKHGIRQRNWVLSSVHPEYSDYYLKNFANLVSIGVRYSLNFGKRLRKGNRSTSSYGIDSGVNITY